MGQEIQKCDLNLSLIADGQLLFISGDILHASAFGNHIVVINNVELATELFEKRAQLYSDRPVIPIAEVYVLLCRSV